MQPDIDNAFYAHRTTRYGNTRENEEVIYYKH